MKNRSARNHSIIPGFPLTLGITVSMLSLFILIPLASILVFSLRLSPGEFVRVILEQNVFNALVTSMLCALGAALANCLFGLILAWVLTRYSFPGRRILDGLIELPFALPTAVAGITLSKMYAVTGELGGPLAKLGIHVSYTHLGILVAMVFVGIPFVVRTVQPVLQKLDPSCEEAALVLGAGRGLTFRRVILPELRPALLTGFGLAFARGLGEYGSVIYISGNSAKNKTQVLSYVIMQKLNYLDYAGAAAIALLMLVISFVILLIINISAAYQWKRVGNSGETGVEIRRQRIRSGREGGLVAISIAFAFFMLIMPLFSVIRNALSRGAAFYLSALQTDEVGSAIGVTLMAVTAALVVTTFFGLAAAWTLTRFTFRGRQALGAMIDIPFSVSPVIAGLSYIMTFGRLGWAWPALDGLNDLLGTDIRIVFALPGVALATIFVTFPFVCRELIPAMNAVGTGEEEAAAMMGASGMMIFRRVTFPHIRWPLIYGMILCAARAAGEFGAVNALSRVRGETFTMTQEIDALYMDGSADSITAAFAVSSLLVLLAVVMLILRNIFEYREMRK